MSRDIAKSDLENFTLRNIIVIIVVDFVRFQFPSRQALVIKPKSLPISRYLTTACRWNDTHTEKDPCTCALNYVVSVERKSVDNLLPLSSLYYSYSYIVSS